MSRPRGVAAARKEAARRAGAPTAVTGSRDPTLREPPLTLRMLRRRRGGRKQKAAPYKKDNGL